MVFRRYYLLTKLVTMYCAYIKCIVKFLTVKLIYGTFDVH